MMNPTATTDRLDAIEAKIDALTALLEDQVERRKQWSELRTDLAPIAGELFEYASRELDEVRDFVEPADLFRLGKRLLRDLPYLEALLNQVESLQQLGADLTPLAREILVTLMARLDELESRSHFTFIRGVWNVLDRVVASFSEEDLDQLSDNVVLILSTVKEMTQPEIMQLLQRAAREMRQTQGEEIGLFRLMWRMRRPQVRRGMSRVLGVIESLAEPVGLDAPPQGSKATTDKQGEGKWPA
jgi:uncharacterized protein YjgD (DUF1641 family)